MKKLTSLKAAIKELNAPSIIDGEMFESQFEFVVVEENDRLYLFDTKENYYIDYLEEQNCLMYDLSCEFGFEFEAETVDKIHERLEKAIKSDLGKNAFLEWENPVKMLIVEE